MNGRRPVSLRISVAQGCELRCLYCSPQESPGAPAEDVLSFDEIVEFVRRVDSLFGPPSVRLTGGEPLLRQGLVRLVARLAGLGVADLALTTNAQRLAERAAELRRAGLRRVNISLDSLAAGTYRRLTRGGSLERALAGIDAALVAGLEPVKLNMVVLRGVNDGEVVRVARFGLERGCRVRFLELMPIGAAAGRHAEWFVPSAETAGRLSAAFELNPLPHEAGVSSRDFFAEGGGVSGIVGFISPCTEPFCDGCRRLRLTVSGLLLGCLARPDGIDLGPLLAECGAQAEARLARTIERALLLKRETRRFADQQVMVRIGG